MIEHRFSAAEGLLGAAALTLGLWLLWPAGPDPAAGHRDRWQETLRQRHAAVEQPEALGAAPISIAEASLAISARRELDGGVGIATVSLADRRLARIADTMPEIGPPTRRFPPDVDEFVVRMPEVEPDLADLGGLDVDHGTVNGAPPLVGVPNRSDGHAWLRYAAVEPVEDGRPKIAIVIDDLGNDRRNTAALNRLPGPLTLAFLPYAGDLAGQTAAARAAGHELLIHMPMEPVTTDWPGPDALLISISQEDFRARLQKNFQSFHGFVGINNHMGSRLTADAASMAMVMTELRGRDLLFLDSKTTSFSVGSREARRFGVPYAQRDVFLDNVAELNAVLRQLRSTEAVARRNGFAIAIGHPTTPTIQALRQWLPEVVERGFSIVPVSTVVALETCQREPLLAGCLPATDAMRANVEVPPQSEG